MFKRVVCSLVCGGALFLCRGVSLLGPGERDAGNLEHDDDGSGVNV